LYLPRVIVRMENLVEWMAEETEVLGENLPRRHFVHHKSHSTRLGIEPGPPRWEASDYPLQLWRGQVEHLATVHKQSNCASPKDNGHTLKMWHEFTLFTNAF
jgi:hypothetical protein